MKATYSNCYGFPPTDALITSELAMAGAIVADRLIEPTLAEAVNQQMWTLGFGWSDDPAADLAGLDAVLSIFLPAARGVLEMSAAIDEVSPEALVVASPTDGSAAYQQWETICADAAALTATTRGLVVERVRVGDPRNARLVNKYAAVRDVDYLTTESMSRRALRSAACGVAGLISLRHRPSEPRVVTLNYGSVGAYARQCHIVDAPPQMRGRAGPRDLVPILSASEPLFLMPRRSGKSKHVVAPEGPILVAGVDIAGVVSCHLVELAQRYAHWMSGRADRIRRTLRRHHVGAVLVPFDTVPDARLLVRSAQAEGIPTLVLNDGWKGDDHQADGMTADIALALSPSMARTYLSRRSHGPAPVVTGDPRNDGLPSSFPPRQQTLKTILIGSFTFSPGDLNCRRSDSERFLVDILRAIDASVPEAHVVLKLHPADRRSVYDRVLDRYPAVEVVENGDVVAMLRDADLYITTYSTSLLQAALTGVPFLYYRINPQRLHAPFANDPVMERRSAETPDGLEALLDNYPRLTEPVPAGWAEEYLGPIDGRCTARVASALRSAAIRR